VDTVANGQEAVAALNNLTYAIVFMDCQMPEMDGYEATTAIRTSEQLTGTRVPIIAMTANVMPGDRERCLQVGMDDYISKPVKAEDLANILQQWVQPTNPSAISSDGMLSQPPLTDTPSVSSALDTQAFIALRELCGPENSAFLQDLVAAFFRDSEAHIAAIRHAIATNDVEALERTAHLLKSSSANVGALGMAELCRTLQMLARTRTLSAAPPLAEQLAHEFSRVKQALQHECVSVRKKKAATSGTL
jgi:CheY-like chemotaxis protein/HPt (histidine-containing phosphotransfer) domain-containing protein